MSTPHAVLWSMIDFTFFTHKSPTSAGMFKPLCKAVDDSFFIDDVAVGRLRWFGHVDREDDNDWVKRCVTWEVEGIRQRGRPKKTCWDCVMNDMESLGL